MARLRIVKLSYSRAQLWQLIIDYADAKEALLKMKVLNVIDTFDDTENTALVADHFTQANNALAKAINEIIPDPPHRYTETTW